MTVLGALTSWALEGSVVTGDSMRSRGSSLRGRTAFSIYRFDNRDRILVIGLFLCLTLTAMAMLQGLTDMVYDPLILLCESIAAANWIFCAGYAILCLMPLGLELWTDHCFRKARATAE